MKNYIGKKFDTDVGMNIISSFEKVAKDYDDTTHYYNLIKSTAVNKPNNNKNIDINKKIIYNCSTKEIKIYNNIQGLRLSKNSLEQIKKNRNKKINQK